MLAAVASFLLFSSGQVRPGQNRRTGHQTEGNTTFLLSKSQSRATHARPRLPATARSERTRVRPFASDWPSQKLASRKPTRRATTATPRRSQQAAALDNPDSLTLPRIVTNLREYRLQPQPASPAGLPAHPILLPRHRITRSLRPDTLNPARFVPVGRPDISRDLQESTSQLPCLPPLHTLTSRLLFLRSPTAERAACPSATETPGTRAGPHFLGFS